MFTTLQSVVKVALGVAMCLFGTVARADPVPVQDDAAIRKLVTDTTWRVDAPTGAGFDMYWDWRGDGTMCFRAQGMSATDPCLDDGTWWLASNMLCWKLSRYGAAGGEPRERCATISDSGAGRMEAVFPPGGSEMVGKLTFEVRRR